MPRSVISRTRRLAFLLAVVVFALVGSLPNRALASDQPGDQPDGQRGVLFLPTLASGAPELQLDAAAAGEPGNVYVMTNETAENGGNAVAMYRRSASGELVANGAVSTGGAGDRNSLGSQGGVVLSDDGRWLLVVNPGSNDLSVFAVQPSGLSLTDRISSNGTRPTSVTIRNNVVYVLNAGGSGNIAGFWMKQGTLEPIAGSTQPAASDAGPAQVQFNAQGTFLVVTERFAKTIVTYPVVNGVAGSPSPHTSVGAVPFGFDIDNQNHVIVSEAQGDAQGTGASSYELGQDGSLTSISQSVGNGQGAACWLVISKNGKFAYTANAATNNLSSYTIAADGSLAVLERDVPADMQPLDMDLSNNGRFLYVIDGRSDTIRGFRINSDGTLADIGVRAPVVATAVGMAAD